MAPAGTPTTAPTTTVVQGVRKTPRRAAQPAAAPMKAAPELKAMTLGVSVHAPDEVRHDSCEGPGCGSGEDTDHHGADGVEVERDGCVVADDLPDDDVQGDGDGDEREDAAWDEGQGAGGEQQAAEEVAEHDHRVVWPRSTPRFIGWVSSTAM
jgi:hypothetical protein